MRTWAIFLTALLAAGPSLAEGDKTCANCHAEPKQQSTLTPALAASDPNAQMYAWIMAEKGDQGGNPTHVSPDSWESKHAQGVSCAKCHAGYAPAPKPNTFSYKASPPCKINCHTPNGANDPLKWEPSPFFKKLSQDDADKIGQWINSDAFKNQNPPAKKDEKKDDKKDDKKDGGKKAPPKKAPASPKPAQQQLADAQGDKGGGGSFDGGDKKDGAGAPPDNGNAVVAPPPGDGKKDVAKDYPTPEQPSMREREPVPAPKLPSRSKDRMALALGLGGVGMAGGAVAGALLGGPLGAVIGGVLGALFGGLLSLI